MRKTAILVGVIVAACAGEASFTIDRAAMSDKYWAIWNDAEQAKIDADIEANRKADGIFAIPAPAGTEVTVEQLDHEFRFGAHIFNYDQLGKHEYNEAYRMSYGPGGIFNQATVAFYWKDYEPVPNRLRAGGDYEDTERFWNSLTREEAMEHPFWRRPAPSPAINWLRRRGCTIHGHILIWGSAKPDWIYDWYCPEDEKRAFDKLGIPRNDGRTTVETKEWIGGYNTAWKQAWHEIYPEVTEAEVAAMAPTFVKRMPEIFRKRVFDVAGAFGEVVDSWDVVNESSTDWALYRKSRTGLPVWKSTYGLMPGDYPLHALLDAKAAFPAKAKLAINDWNVAKDFQEQVRDLENEGAKIDIVGCQMHIFNTNDCARLAKGETDINWVSTPADIQEHLDLMARLGRPLHVSEITITSPGADDQSRMIQAVLTRNIYRKWFSHKALMGITWWNTVDGGGVKGEPLVSGLFTSDLKKKPAYEALDALINGEWKTRLTAEVEREGGGGEGGVIRFRGFRGTYRLEWTCPKCGARHHRDVRLTGNGTVETAAPAQVRGCGRDIRSFVVDGRPVTLTGEEKKLDLAKIYPNGVGKEGRDGTQWAEVVFKVRAPKAGEYVIYRHNDYYGELSVNGGKAVSLKGPWRGYELTSVTLAAGENTIRFRTRAGCGGKWACAFRLANELELVR